MGFFEKFKKKSNPEDPSSTANLPEESPVLPDPRKEYPLVFFRKENGACIERIDFVCYGYETSFDIIERMYWQELLDKSYSHIILHWPSEPGDYMNRVLRLREFDPQPGRVFIIEQGFRPPIHQSRSGSSDRGGFSAPLYGCPRADLPRHKAMLENCQVDVIAYE